MFAKRMTRIGALLVVVLVVAVLALALNTGTSEAQGGGGRGYRGGGAGAGTGIGTQPMDGTGTQNQRGGSQGRGTGMNLNRMGLPPASGLPLTDEAISALEAGLQDEHHAYDTYQAVIDQFGAVAPFTRIQQAEAQHIATLEAMFARYNVAIPTIEPLSAVPSFETLADACSAGAAAEVANLNLYDQWISQVSEYPDLVAVFTALRNASEFNHLPAFENCAG